MNKFQKTVLHVWLASLAVLTVFFTRSELFQPLQPDVFRHAEKRLNALWIGAMEYHVDYAAFPILKPSQISRTPLTSPIAYLTATYADPFSTENKDKFTRLDLTGEFAMSRVQTLHALILLFGLGLVFLRVFPMKPRGLEQIMFLMIIFCAPVLTLTFLSGLGPVKLGAISLILFLSCPWVLFFFKRLSIECLALFGISAMVIVIGLYRSDPSMLWGAVALIGIGGARIVMKSGPLGKAWLQEWREQKVSLRLQMEVAALCLTILAGFTAILLSDWVMREKQTAKEIELSGRPFSVLSDKEFFLASSNGPDYQPNWREDDLLGHIEKHGKASVESYIASLRYDPTNGVMSRGDYIIFARKPEPPVKGAVLPDKQILAPGEMFGAGN